MPKCRAAGVEEDVFRHDMTSAGWIWVAEDAVKTGRASGADAHSAVGFRLDEMEEREEKVRG